MFILSKKYIPTYFAIVLSSFRYLVIMSCIVSFIVDLLLVDISTCVSADNNHFVHLWNLTSHPKHWRHACKEEYEDYCDILYWFCVYLTSKGQVVDDTWHIVSPSYAVSAARPRLVVAAVITSRDWRPRLTSTSTSVPVIHVIGPSQTPPRARNRCHQN